MTTLRIPTAEWALPFLDPHDYKGLKGGRGSGKSHFFADLAVETMVMDPYIDFVALREVQKSLRFSAQKLVEEKIYKFDLGHMFKVLDGEIRRLGTDGTTTGRMIFQGMQDHSADSIKSLEGFNRAWFEEASRMSQRSLDLLRPTIREEGSEIWFSWNPDQETDPIEKFLVKSAPRDSVVAHINFQQNPFCPQKLIKEAADWHKNDPDTYGHIWLGDYQGNAEDQVLHGKWEVAEFDVQDSWAGPYYGTDWGFSTDPNVLIEIFVDTDVTPHRIYIRQELHRTGVEVDDTPDFFAKMIGSRKPVPKYVIRADNARPELISYVKRHGFPRIKAAEKWAGSIEDGISKLRSFGRIVVHPDCPATAQECKLYKYKRDKLTDEVLPDIIDKHNHCIDAIRYAIEPLTKKLARSFWEM